MYTTASPVAADMPASTPSATPNRLDMLRIFTREFRSRSFSRIASESSVDASFTNSSSYSRPCEVNMAWRRDTSVGIFAASLRKESTTDTSGALVLFMSHVAVLRIADHREAFDELPYAGVERKRGLVAGALDFLVRHDVVSLVRVFADVRLMNDERRQVLLNALTEIELRKIRVR